MLKFRGGAVDEKTNDVSKVDEKDKDGSVSSKKREANRRNAQFSTGPRTEVGKKHSRLNSLKHGILASVVVVSEGAWENPDEFNKLLRDLARHYWPVGKLEEMFVEQMRSAG
jgi:hypothetical protein